MKDNKRTSLWVPVAVVENDGVRGLQVDAQSARARGHEEDEEGAALLVEAPHVNRALNSIGRPCRHDEKTDGGNDFTFRNSESPRYQE